MYHLGENSSTTFSGMSSLRHLINTGIQNQLSQPEKDKICKHVIYIANTLSFVKLSNSNDQISNYK